MTPEITVIIPTFNRADLVRQTIQSVLDQSFKHYEILVVDDGSTDMTREVLDDLIESGKIRYVFQENSGRSDARNKGMANSSGDYLMFLDSDDLLYPDSLEILFEAATAYPVSGLVAGKRDFLDNLGNKIEMIYSSQVKERICGEKIRTRKIREIFYAPSTYIVKRQLAQAVNGFDKGMEPAEDFDFFIKCCNCSAITVLTEPVVRVRRHEGNTSDVILREASIRISKKNLDRLESEPMPEEIIQLGRLKAEWLLRMGDDSYALDRNADSLMYYCRSVMASPGILLDPHVSRQIVASTIPNSIRGIIKKFRGS